MNLIYNKTFKYAIEIYNKKKLQIKCQTIQNKSFKIEFGVT